MPRLAIFLDDGGVLNDNQLRGAQWQRLVAAFFVPRLGGAPDAWMAANREMAISPPASNAHFGTSLERGGTWRLPGRGTAGEGGDPG